MQLVYYLVCFALPIETKWTWYTTAHLGFVEPAGVLLAILSLAWYLHAAWQALRRYHAWLDDVYSTTDVWRLSWLYQILGAVTVVAFIGAAYMLVDSVFTPLDYFDRMPLMVAFAILAYVLGALGWRYGEIVYPVRTQRASNPEPVTAAADADAAAAALPQGDDARGDGYAEIAAAWS